jgi:hypothetical protein
MTERSCTQQLAGPRPGVDDAALVDALTDTWWRALRPDDATGS